MTTLLAMDPLDTSVDKPNDIDWRSDIREPLRDFALDKGGGRLGKVTLPEVGVGVLKCKLVGARGHPDRRDSPIAVAPRAETNLWYHLNRWCARTSLDEKPDRRQVR